MHRSSLGRIERCGMCVSKQGKLREVWDAWGGVRCVRSTQDLWQGRVTTSPQCPVCVQGPVALGVTAVGSPPELPWDQPSDSCQEYSDWKEKKTYLPPWKKIDSAPLGKHPAPSS